MAEIEIAGWTGDGMVRHSAFKGLREDMPAAQVEAEKSAKVSKAIAKPAALRSRGASDKPVVMC